MNEKNEKDAPGLRDVWEGLFDEKWANSASIQRETDVQTMKMNMLARAMYECFHKQCKELEAAQNKARDAEEAHQMAQEQVSQLEEANADLRNKISFCEAEVSRLQAAEEKLREVTKEHEQLKQKFELLMKSHQTILEMTTKKSPTKTPKKEGMQMQMVDTVFKKPSARSSNQDPISFDKGQSPVLPMDLDLSALGFVPETDDDLMSEKSEGPSSVIFTSTLVPKALQLRKKRKLNIPVSPIANSAQTKHNRSSPDLFAAEFDSGPQEIFPKPIRDFTMRSKSCANLSPSKSSKKMKQLKLIKPRTVDKLFIGKNNKNECGADDDPDDFKNIMKPGTSRNTLQRIKSAKSLLNTSFDRLPEKPKSPYKYKGETVRKKAQRQQMYGNDCDECRNFYALSDLDDAMLQERLNICSRHRSKYHGLPPSTPPGIWNLPKDFPPEVTP
ncbi:unnamed protein product [Darwinula stevensoni]|uniref:DNA endonuclease RBBP8 n=1 Tax=Darwinula stevensoni TaxID=69355 RepID=A0A7R8X3C6_9CRUS|nr:unnamed protein product [Darwinula stevensoni]CAG0884843.1 unnamed protein product [Darwinula stevensoni]